MGDLKARAHADAILNEAVRDTDAAGHSAIRAATWMREQADACGHTVCTDWNGAVMYVVPGEDPGDAVQRWSTERDLWLCATRATIAARLP